MENSPQLPQGFYPTGQHAIMPGMPSLCGCEGCGIKDGTCMIGTYSGVHCVQGCIVCGITAQHTLCFTPRRVVAAHRQGTPTRTYPRIPTPPPKHQSQEIT